MMPFQCKVAWIEKSQAYEGETTNRDCWEHVLKQVYT